MASSNDIDVVDGLTKKMMNAFNNPSSTWTSTEPDDDSDDGVCFGTCPRCLKAVKGRASLVKGQHYHVECFVCDHCKQSLGAEKFYVINGKNYCLKDRNLYLEKCQKCEQYIEENAVKTSGSGGSKKIYHPECFTCDKCNTVIQGKFFTTEDSKFLCEEDFLMSREKCFRCARPIIESSLRALGNLYHPDCFMCSLCPKKLDGKEFFVREETGEPVCADDFERYVAKTCDGCKKKIVEERFISMSNGKYHHEDCYNRQILRQV